MSRPKTTQDLYGEAFRRIDAMHAGVKKFRGQVERVKEVFAQPAGTCCIFPAMEPEEEDPRPADDDRRVRCATPQPVAEAGLEEFRLTLAELRSLTL